MDDVVHVLGVSLFDQEVFRRKAFVVIEEVIWIRIVFYWLGIIAYNFHFIVLLVEGLA